MKDLSPETLAFIRLHQSDDVHVLAFQSGKQSTVDVPTALIQIAGRQIAGKKIPLWASYDDIRYPPHLSMEQCSSEITARYKASLVSGETFADLTGGLGVDCSFIAKGFRHVDYVERQGALCNLALHNFSVLGLCHIRVHVADAVDYLRRMDPVDCLFLDPARRDGYGAKKVAISDCEPDVGRLEPLLVEKGRQVMLKLSPLLDITTVLRGLKYVSQVHVVAVNNECKELIILLKKSGKMPSDVDKAVVIYCEQAVDNVLTSPFTFTLQEERDAVCTYTGEVGAYLYEPGSAFLKAGAYKLLSSCYGVKKLHPNSHLYTSDVPVSFPGRRFRVEAVSGFGKKEMKAFMQGMTKANLTVRNFPATVMDLRKKLKLKEGGDVYLFATTLKDGKKVLIRCAKQDFEIPVVGRM